MALDFGRGQFPDLIRGLLAGRELSAEVVSVVVDALIDGQLGEVEAAAFLVACEAKGVTPTEVEAFAISLLRHADAVEVPGETYDITGTGGDGLHTVNISTMAALVVAGTGRVVVKHGNRGASSKCGAADVLETLGVNLRLSAPQVEKVVSEAGIGFCFAGQLHKSTAAVARVRRTLGIRTLFNYLGPLTNPSRPSHVVAGVSVADMAPVVSQVLTARGARALVVRGEEGMDELSVCGPSSLWVTHDGLTRRFTLCPSDLGLPQSTFADLRGGSCDENAEVVRRVLGGERKGPILHAVLANAAAAMATADLYNLMTRDGVVAAIRAHMDEAAQAVSSGAARTKLELLISASRGVECPN
jgi:anthranilate phosphoribosyltransferase